MAIAVASSPGSGSITHAVTACQISVTGASPNTATGYDNTKYPASPQVVYYFSAEKAGSDALVSPRFAVSANGDGYWNDVIFPSAGAWTLRLRADSNDNSVASTALTVA